MEHVEKSTTVINDCIHFLSERGGKKKEKNLGFKATNPWDPASYAQRHGKNYEVMSAIFWFQLTVL